jgi:hypothetical protein
MKMLQIAANVFEQIALFGEVADFEPRPASCPTMALPGTPAKIAVFQDRLERGEEIFHKEDPQLDYSTADAAALGHVRYKRIHCGGRKLGSQAKKPSIYRAALEVDVAPPKRDR